MNTSDRLIRMADRLGKLEAGSPEADHAIHDALDREGPVFPYSRNEAAVRLLLLPEGFEWCQETYSGGLVYASCRRQGLEEGEAHPHHGQWGQSLAPAMCGAVLRAYAGLRTRAGDEQLHRRPISQSRTASLSGHGGTMPLKPPLECGEGLPPDPRRRDAS